MSIVVLTKAAALLSPPPPLALLCATSDDEIAGVFENCPAGLRPLGGDSHGAAMSAPPPLPRHAPASGAAALKSLPLGDSITFGCGDKCSKNCEVAPRTTPCSNCSEGWRGARA